MSLAFSTTLVVIGTTAMSTDAESTYMTIAQSTEMQNFSAIQAEMPLSKEVEAYRTTVQQVANEYRIGEYTNLLLAIMMQESGGRGSDVFQSSESMGLPVNSLGVQESINQGVKVVVDRLSAAGVTSPSDIKNIKTALQGYNFGGGYISWAKFNGGCWTQLNTDSYAKKYSNGKKRSGKKAQQMGIWAYGDSFYTQHVLRYYSYGQILGGIQLGGKQNVITEAKKHLGKPYVWGATGPNTFDCSGFVYYVFKATGTYTGRRLTADGYKHTMKKLNASQAVPGDIVTMTKRGSSRAHHIAIYIGNGEVIHAPRTGDVVKISKVSNWSKEIIEYGRLGS